MGVAGHVAALAMATPKELLRVSSLPPHGFTVAHTAPHAEDRDGQADGPEATILFGHEYDQVNPLQWSNGLVLPGVQEVQQSDTELFRQQ